MYIMYIMFSLFFLNFLFFGSCCYAYIYYMRICMYIFVYLSCVSGFSLCFYCFCLSLLLHHKIFHSFSLDNTLLHLNIFESYAHLYRLSLLLTLFLSLILNFKISISLLNERTKSLVLKELREENFSLFRFTCSTIYRLATTNYFAYVYCFYFFLLNLFLLSNFFFFL